MTSVVLYNASWSTFGGGEKYLCAMADVLSRTGEYDVRLLSDNRTVTKKDLQKYFNLDMERVQLLSSIGKKEIGKYLARADIAIVVSNFRPYGRRAKNNVYVLQIPYSNISMFRVLTKMMSGQWREAGKDMYRRQLLKDARSANLVLVYSDFVRKTLNTHHDVTSEVLYPPIDDFAGGSHAKQHVILSVGRFFTGLYNDKRYDVLIEAFKELRKHLPDDSWTYRLVGSCGHDAASVRYLATLQEAAEGYPISFHLNCPYRDLQRHYQDATLFWHAAGFGIDEADEPERVEHFGMSTVEAMSAGCVPIVVQRGGQKEIVIHGESGYLWSTVEELIERTAGAIHDPLAVARLSQNARARFSEFDRDHFSDRLLALMHGLA